MKYKIMLLILVTISLQSCTSTTSNDDVQEILKPKLGGRAYMDSSYMTQYYKVVGDYPAYAGPSDSVLIFDKDEMNDKIYVLERSGTKIKFRLTPEKEGTTPNTNKDLTRKGPDFKVDMPIYWGEEKYFIK